MNPYQTAKSVLLALSLAATILASGAEARITPAALDRTQIPTPCGGGGGGDELAAVPATGPGQGGI